MEKSYTVKKITSSEGMNRVEVISDDLTVTCHFRIAAEFFGNISLNEGDTADERTFDTLSEMHLLTEAVSKALDILAYSPRSRKALVSKLKTKYGISDEKAREAADYAVKRGYIDEEYQASKMALDFASYRKRGKRRIVSDLAAKGYPPEIAREAAESVPEKIYREGVLYHAKRKKDLLGEDAGARKKAVSALLRQGFSFDEIKKAVAALKKEEL